MPDFLFPSAVLILISPVSFLLGRLLSIYKGAGSLCKVIFGWGLIFLGGFKFLAAVGQGFSRFAVNVLILSFTETGFTSHLCTGSGFPVVIVVDGFMVSVLIDSEFTLGVLVSVSLLSSLSSCPPSQSIFLGILSSYLPVSSLLSVPSFLLTNIVIFIWF